MLSFTENTFGGWTNELPIDMNDRATKIGSLNQESTSVGSAKLSCTFVDINCHRLVHEGTRPVDVMTYFIMERDETRTVY